MLRHAVIATIALLAASCNSTRTSQSIELPAASIETLPLVEVREIDAPHGFPPVGRYFEVQNNSSEAVLIQGYGPGNYLQKWQRLEFGVWIDQPDLAVGSRLQQVPLASGEVSMFRGSAGKPGDRVGLQISQGDRTAICWSDVK